MPHGKDIIVVGKFFYTPAFYPVKLIRRNLGNRPVSNQISQTENNRQEDKITEPGPQSGQKKRNTQQDIKRVTRQCHVITAENT